MRGTPVLRLAAYAMGTRFELLVMAEEPERFRPAAEAAIEEIEALHRALTRFEPGSLVSHIQRTAAEKPVPLDADTYRLFEDALAVWGASAGAFDPTVAPILDALDAHPGAKAFDPVRRAGAGQIELDPAAHTIRFTAPGVRLDLGSIAKGHALDLAAGLLRAHGVTSAFLHGGTSSLIGIGTRPNKPGWRVALGREPDASVVSLHDSALSVSGTMGRTMRRGRRRVSHVIDARTGVSLKGDRRAAVVGPSARLADAWSTAALVLGGRPPHLSAEWDLWLFDEAGGWRACPPDTEPVAERASGISRSR